MRHFAFVNVVLPIALFCGHAGATTITSSFGTDLDGWTANPQGILAFVATGGNPGGYLEETDASANGNMHVAAPAKFLGDLTGADSFSVDLITYGTPITIQAAFGTLTFLNSAAALSITLDLGNPLTVWANYATPLTPAAFGVNAATYAAVMSNVTSLTLILEADKAADTEKVGMDNFTISGANLIDAAVPEPASFAFVGAALVLYGVARRSPGRRRSCEKSH